MKSRKQNITNRYARLLKVVLLSIALLFSFVSVAQKKGKNLVPNPSFEKHKNKSNVISNATPWQNVGTVDYYMKADKKDTSRYKGAHTGTCYSGLRFQAVYKEYMYVQLLEPLEKGRTYQFKMFVRLMGVSTVTVKQLGVYFSDDAFKMNMNFDKEGIVDSTYKKGISGTFNWIPIHGEYLAHGGEKYIIIGNFTTKVKDDFVRQNKWDIFEFKEAYYFIDDISVRKIIISTDSLEALKKTQPKFVYTLPDSFSTGQVFEIKNLKFEPGTTKLMRASYPVLDEIVHSLNDHPFMEIQINGYTDNQGNEATNRKVSKDRAKAVYDYLLSQGVINPMTYKGFGPTQPIAPNDTEENKAKNRRVEFVIIKP